MWASTAVFQIGMLLLLFVLMLAVVVVAEAAFKLEDAVAVAIVRVSDECNGWSIGILTVVASALAGWAALSCLHETTEFKSPQKDKSATRALNTIAF